MDALGQLCAGEHGPGASSPAIRVVLVAVLVVFMSLAATGRAESQDHFVEVTAGVAHGFFPSRVFTVTAPDGTQLATRLEGATGGGLTIGFRPLERWSLQLEGIWIDDAQASTSGTSVAPAASIDVPTAYGYYGLAVRYRPPLLGSSANPFVVAGLGKKEFDTAIAGSASPLAGSAGVGIQVEIDGWPDVRTEVRDYVSSFDTTVLPGLEKATHTQHDIFWTVGAVFELF